MIRLIHGDCLEKMKDIPDNSVDLVLTDPPYGTTICKWDSVIPFGPMWGELKRIAKPNAAILLFGSQPFTSVLGASNVSMLKYAWVWEKSRPTDFLQAKRKPLKGFEDILVFYSNSPTYNPQGLVEINRTVKNTGTKARGRNSLKGNGDQTFHGTVTGSDENDCYKQTATNYPRGIVKFAQDSDGFHPTQKPVALLEYLIKTYTLENDTVLDFTMGSGSTGVACKNLNRSFIGIEKDDKYFEVAKNRIGAL